MAIEGKAYACAIRNEDAMDSSETIRLRHVVRAFGEEASGSKG